MRMKVSWISRASVRRRSLNVGSAGAAFGAADARTDSGAFGAVWSRRLHKAQGDLGLGVVGVTVQGLFPVGLRAVRQAVGRAPLGEGDVARGRIGHAAKVFAVFGPGIGRRFRQGHNCWDEDGRHERGSAQSHKSLLTALPPYYTTTSAGRLIKNSGPV
jgi:hypothetical protein